MLHTVNYYLVCIDILQNNIDLTAVLKYQATSIMLLLNMYRFNYTVFYTYAASYYSIYLDVCNTSVQSMSKIIY